MRPKNRQAIGIVASVVSAAILLALSAGTAVLDRRMAGSAPVSRPRPSRTYEEALGRLADLRARDTSDVLRPTVFLGTGSRTETAVVLFHGLTNNPHEFERIGAAYRAAGCNVLIPRLPEHGRRDRLTRALSDIDAGRLAEAADEAVDIAAGLGENVEVVGFSGGGALAAWAANERPEVTDVVMISPLFGVDPAPGWAARSAVAWSHVLPDLYFWWNPLEKEDHRPLDAYPRYSIRSLGAFLELDYALQDRGWRRRLPLESAVLVINRADRSIDEEAALSVFRERFEPNAERSSVLEYSAEDDLWHDLVDPEGLNAERLDEIYARLLPALGLPSED